jgi:DNA-binding FadR family transcriptional regulator
MNNGLITVQASAVRAICGKLAASQLRDIRRSVEQACLIPRHVGWERKATAYAEIFVLLADAADDLVLAQVLNSGAGLAHHLMTAAGPAADRLTCSSRKRLLAFLTAGDAEGAAREMEGNLRTLIIMGDAASRTRICPSSCASLSSDSVFA